jgi:2'-5' RNA ligase
MFVAIDLDDRIKSALASLAASVKQPVDEGFKFVDVQQAHLTLVFLGDVQPPLSDRIVSAMNDPIALRPFRIAFGQAGIFPPRGAPRVLWLGIGDGADDVIALQRIVARRLEAVGATLENRPFHPHLTIGRWRHSRPSQSRSLPALPSAGTMTVERVSLYESRLSSKAPAHFERALARLEPMEPLER